MSGSAPMRRRERVGVQRPRAAEGDEPEVARVVAALDRHDAQRGVHVLVGDVDDRLRGGHGVDAQPLGDRRHGPLGRLDVERQAPAELGPAREPAEHDVGVGDRRLRPAASVAGGPGIGARAARADLERAGEVQVGDRAAAGAHAVDVGAAGLELVVAELRLALDGDLAVTAQRDVGRRPAHVEREDVRHAHAAREVRRAHRPAGRAGERDVDRPLLRGPSAHRAAVGAHDVQPSA